MKRRTSDQNDRKLIRTKPLMKLETFKSILLTVLVAISVLLTWNLWTYQFNLERVESNEDDYIDVAIDKNGSFSSIAKVVYPTKVIFHTDEQYYGTLHTAKVNTIYEAVRSAKFDQFTSFKSKSVKDRIDNSEFVEVIFPGNVSPDLFKKVLTFVNGENTPLDVQDPVFDRIAFHKSAAKQTDMIAVFKNQKNNIVATAKVTGLSFSDLLGYQEGVDQLYSLEELDSGNKVFLPREAPEILELRYYFDAVKEKTFIEALFLNKDVEFKGGDSYSDGIRLLKFEEGYVLKFIDPGSNKGNKGWPQNIVQQSFDHVNGNSGWTDQYIFSHYNGFEASNEISDLNGSRSVVTFRLMMGEDNHKYPVFSPLGLVQYDDAATIRLWWQNGGLKKFARTRMNMRPTPEPEFTEKIELPSGPDFLQSLSNVEEVKAELVEDIRIGYKMENTGYKLITLHPKWFILYNGEWQTLDDFKPAQLNKQGVGAS